MTALLSLSGIAKSFDNGTQAIARLDLDVADLAGASHDH